ncbi:MAG TPA: exodeoxyribonuclease VII large subunit, partial [Candidatus Binatia bacterium]|nr:exodeoxyribonuclease VII large subunit [Candidatus Binatia bacterium]
MSARRATARWDPREGEPHVYTVGEIVTELNALLTGEYPAVTVEGEISDYKAHASGHEYFCIKDRRAQLQVVFFANQPRLRGVTLGNGVAVRITGCITIYEPRGSMQLKAERVVPVGYGSLQIRFEELKRKLQAEGLFAEGRKRPIPRYATRIALVTSLSGAAIQDFLRVYRQRLPHVRLTIAPARVQGEGAATQIAAAIRLVNEWGGADFIVIGRGGGSMEDLWAFNEEVVVRAIVASRIPVVSAVGHESDYTLSDFAADARAATPSHAAQMGASQEEARQALHRLAGHARERLMRELQRDRRHVEGLRTHRALHDPYRRIETGRQTLDNTRDVLVRALEGWALRRRGAVGSASTRLRAHAPARIVERMRERLLDLRRRAERASTGD